MFLQIVSSALAGFLLCAVPLAVVDPSDTVEEEHGVRQPLPSAEEIAKLPADGGPEFNRLVFESSPYLRQHARNPVDWWPWGPEAFARAKEVDKPVFLSIGYSTCHWCHVMEHESFEDAEVAALMNEHFICIKVDREERPDVDQIYMTVTQGMNGRGGWPMTVVMTPNKEPFFSGTYYPKESRGGRFGMLELVPELGRRWRDERGTVVQAAGEVREWLAKASRVTPGKDLGAGVLDQAFAALQGRFDAEHGGFGQRPKFPSPSNLRFLLRYARTAEAADKPEVARQAIEMVEKQLDGMQRGGIWDHVGHGLHRYSTDRRWFVPHFEKMLYDQGLVAQVAVEAWQATENPRWRRFAEEIFDYVLRDMTSPAGGFYSAEDADSEGEEGLFYLWTPAEVIDVLGPEDGKFMNELLGVEEGGNFLEEATGKKTGECILYLAETVADYAAARELDPEALEARFEALRKQLFDAREPRVHPLKDDKVLTDWNGLMIAALAHAGRAFDDPEYTRAAEDAAGFCLAELRREDGSLAKRWRQGEAGLDGVLEDYAYLSHGLIELYQTTFDPRWLRAALELTDYSLEHFWDDTDGGFFTASDSTTDLIVRAKESYDGARPAGNSVAASNLVRLARLTGNITYEERAAELFRAFAAPVRRAPNASTWMLSAVDFTLGRSFEIVVCGEPGAEDVERMLSALARPFLPNKIVVFRPTGLDPEIAKLVPYALEQGALDGRATAYVCEDFACQAPTTDLAAVLATLGLE